MKKFEVTFPSTNSENYTKPITMLMYVPENLNQDTGIMLFTHGWSGNRFQHQDKMDYVLHQDYNVIAVSVEYRQSGFDFDPIRGAGSCLPYDLSLYQTFDVLNGLRVALNHFPSINRKRIFHYGGSQGGHIALLGGIFAPDTFAFIYASCPIVYLDAWCQGRVGRTFAPYELEARNVLTHVALLKPPLFLEHGTADTTVNYERHTLTLEKRLNELEKTCKVTYYENAEHDLTPTTTKLEAFKQMISEPIQDITNPNPDDFQKASYITIPCGEQELHIDWEKSWDHPHVFEFKKSDIPLE